ncbi:MAG TPA: FCD domain-containing protein, partial [Candidatus Elarobacter sp.]
YRFFSLSDPERRHETVVEHQAILDALTAHDEAAAGSATASHIANARAAVLRLTAAQKAATAL